MDWLFSNLEGVIGSVVAIACIGLVALFAVPVTMAIARKNRARRQAARAWPAASGKVIDSKVVMSRALHMGLTVEEAEARIGKQRVLAIALGVLDDPMEFIEDRVSASPAESGHWPLVVYEYEVNGVRYLNNCVRADELDQPTRGGFVYSKQVIKRYPVGAKVTVYYDPQNPRLSALER